MPFIFSNKRYLTGKENRNRRQPVVQARQTVTALANVRPRLMKTRQLVQVAPLVLFRKRRNGHRRHFATVIFRRHFATRQCIRIARQKRKPRLRRYHIRNFAVRACERPRPDIKRVDRVPAAVGTGRDNTVLLNVNTTSLRQTGRLPVFDGPQAKLLPKRRRAIRTRISTNKMVTRVPTMNVPRIIRPVEIRTFNLRLALNR